MSVCNNAWVGSQLIRAHAWTRGLSGAVVITAGLSLAGCGATQRPARTQASTAYPVQIVAARFPARQRLAEQTRLTIAVRNAGRRALPDVAVTITNPRYGTSVQPFATYLHMPNLEGHSRAAWVVDRPPGPCRFSCRAGGPGGAATPETHTWTLGRLAPGATARFEWAVTAVMAGRFRVRYAVGAELGARPSAVLADGRVASGTFDVQISSAPEHETVSDSGAIVKSG